MPQLHMPASQPVQEASSQARRAVGSPVGKRLARVGYATKGIVYLLVGVLAIRLAIGSGGGTPGRHTALQAVYTQPFGRALLALIILGLLAFGLWSLAQGFFDTEGKGTNAKGIVERIAYAAVGVSYLALAAGAIRLEMGAGSTGKSSTASTQGVTAGLLAHPYGEALVILVGLIVLGVAVALFGKAWTARFMRHLSLDALAERGRTAILALGRAGYAALGCVFVIIGLFLIDAALSHNPQKARGLGGALTTLLHQPFGPALLVAVALGLFAYGVFSLVEARYRRVSA